MSSSVFWEGRDMFLFFVFFIYIYEFGKFLRYFSCVCVCRCYYLYFVVEKFRLKMLTSGD